MMNNHKLNLIIVEILPNGYNGERMMSKERAIRKGWQAGGV